MADEPIIDTAQTEELTPEQVKANELEQFEAALRVRAKEISDANGSAKVTPLWYLDPLDPENGKPIIGYLKEPNRATKGNIMDVFVVSTFRAQQIALQASIMKDVSDARLWSDSQIYDGVVFAAGEEALYMIKKSISQFKKK